MKKLQSSLHNVTPVEMLNIEKNYLAEYARQGDQEAQAALFEIYLKDIVAIAKEQANNTDVYRLIEEGCLGLVFAIQCYQPNKDDDFDPFALNHIRLNIMRALESQILCCA